ncbi:MAG TPA: ribosome small subunit-dependent GTPase A [Caulobacteraceae bacterium]|nr:ribosome small subunit-dependent GTPase A [Caulobacteraceae bacterium]
MLNSYGWTPERQHDFATYAVAGLIPARVTAQHRSGYRLITQSGDVAGHLPASCEPPATGDWLAVEPGQDLAVIRQRLPRSSAFVRRAAGAVREGQVVAANIDVALLVASMNADFNLRRLERYLAVAYESGATPVIVLTKADLAHDPQAFIGEAEAIAFGTPVIAVSAVTGHGYEALAQRVPVARTTVLLGSSGVGKSTVVNTLAGNPLMTTAPIREDDARGRHTTTHRQLMLLPSGALILDTPGMRELGLWDAETGLSAAFSEIETLAEDCRFHDCRHGSEPGCAVQAALADGVLDAGRWRSYEKLQAELAFERRKNDPREASEHRRQWASIHKAARQRMKIKYGD